MLAVSLLLFNVFVSVVLATSFPASLKFPDFSFGSGFLSDTATTYYACTGYNDITGISLMGGAPDGEMNELQHILADIPQTNATFTGSLTFTTQSNLVLPFAGHAKLCAQLNDTLYAIPTVASRIVSFNLSEAGIAPFLFRTVINTNVFDPNNRHTDGTNGADSICIAAKSSGGGYLFIIGGMNSSNASSYINLTSSTEYAWTDGPAMHHERSKALCIVDERTNTLYAIGGEGYSDMESFDVTSPFSEWSLLDATLPSDICCGNAMLYGDYIFLVGAPTPSSKVVVFVIDRSSQSVYSPDGLSLVMDRVGPSSIIIDDILYLFSGEDLYGDALTSWEYVCLNGNCSFPTTTPTKTPSANPTVPTDAPTAEYTVFIGQSPVNWENAEAYCVGLSGHLLSIHSNDTQTAAAELCETRVHVVNNSAISYGCFIGLYFNDSAAVDGSAWSWTDGTAVDYGFNSDGSATTGVYPWFQNEPNNLYGTEKYVHLQRNSWDPWTWNDLHGNGKAYPICKGPQIPIPSTEPTFVPTAYPTYDISGTSYCNFSVNHTNLSRSTYKTAVGYSSTTKSIVILGGITPGENMQALSLNLDDFGTTDYGLNALSIALDGLSQYYTQINHTLYVLDDFATIYAFDLETVNLNSNAVVVLDSSRVWAASSSCLTADTNRGYIFMIDGGNSMLNTILISDGQSIGISDTNFSRPNLVCIYDDQTDILYAIGGEGYKSVLTMEVTPYIEAAENGTPEPVWSQMPDGLPDVFCCGQAFLYRDDILLIGSRDADLSDPMSFYIIERFGDHSIYSADYGLSLVTPRIGASAIIVDDILYLFSGTNAERSSLTSWEYVNLSTICLGTTAEPTIHPTIDVAETPTKNSTGISTESPGLGNPISSQTFDPTSNPTSNPTTNSITNLNTSLEPDGGPMTSHEPTKSPTPIATVFIVIEKSSDSILWVTVIVAVSSMFIILIAVVVYLMKHRSSRERVEQVKRSIAPFAEEEMVPGCSGNIEIDIDDDQIADHIEGDPKLRQQNTADIVSEEGAGDHTGAEQLNSQHKETFGDDV